jgi:hypothetical protein
VTDPNTSLTASDRLVADWLVSHIEALPDDVHEKLTERLAIKEEPKLQTTTGNIFRKIKA